VQDAVHAVASLVRSPDLRGVVEHALRALADECTEDVGPVAEVLVERAEADARLRRDVADRGRRVPVLHEHGAGCLEERSAGARRLPTQGDLVVALTAGAVRRRLDRREDASARIGLRGHGGQTS
jgi:hypothetical protein